MTIDELVVKLSLDPTQFNRGTQEGQNLLRKFKDEVKKTADQTEHEAIKMADGFSRVTKELLGLGAVMLGLGGLKEMVTSTVARAGGTGMAGTIFGINPEQLNRFENAMEQAGVAVETTRGSVGALATDIARLVHMGKGSLLEGAPALAQLGITELDRDPISFAMKFHQALLKNPKVLQEPGLANLIAGQIQGLQPMLGGLANPKLDEFLATAQNATAGQIQAARDLSAAATALQQAGAGIQNAIMGNFAPAAIDAMKAMTEWVRGLQSGQSKVAGSEGILNLDPVGAAGDIGSALGGQLPSWADFRRFMLRMTMPSKAFNDLMLAEMGPAAPPGLVGPGYDPMSDHSVPISPYSGLPYANKLAAIMERQGRRSSGQFISPTPTSDDHSIDFTANIYVTTPLGADARTTGGIIASYLKGALPSMVGAAR